MSAAQPAPRPRRRRLRLGDAIATVAQPVARLLDHHLGTDLANCSSCAERRRILNGDPP